MKTLVKVIGGKPHYRAANSNAWVPIRRLLANGDSNTKLRKNGKNRRVITRGLSLAPHKSAGIGNVCPHSSAGCREVCLNEQGRAAVFSAIKRAREIRAQAYYLARDWFIEQLFNELIAANETARATDSLLAVRLNVFSDIAWERIAPHIFGELSDVQFYDYTKNPDRAGCLLPNYYLTYSVNERNNGIEHLSRGLNVAAVFADRSRPYVGNRSSLQQLPKTYFGFRIFDGDQTDLRFMDPRGRKRGVVIGLRLKAHSYSDRQRAISSRFAIVR